jgi:hypothetical protein
MVSLVFAAAARLPASAMQATLPETTMLGSAKDVTIKGPQTKIDILVPKQALRAALSDLDTPQTVQLTLRNVSADSPPGTLFAVYVARTTDPAKRQQVGTISWYGAFMHRGQAHSPEHRTLTYDATAALQALGGRAVADSGLSVVIEATTGRVSATGSAADAAAEKALAALAFRPQSNLRIQAVEVHAAHAT